MDPRVDADPDSCERDYSVPCPAGFVNVGAVKGADEEYCAASPEYDGPCSSEGHKLMKMSSKARARWSRTCEANWPCKTCERDYGVACPSGWSTVAGTMKCAAPGERGPAGCQRSGTLLLSLLRV